MFLKEANEVLRILKAEIFGYLLGIHCRVEQLILGYIYHLQLNVFLSGLSCFGFHKIAEIV